MTCRATRRERILVSRARPPALPRRPSRPTPRAPASRSTRSRWSPTGPLAGTTDLEALERLLADPDRPVAGVVAAQPNVLGLLEDMPEIGRLAHAAGALFVSVIEPVSLAVLAPPGEYGADIAAGEGQPLGIPLQYGGPYLGIVACTDALVRQIPGRLVGHDHGPRRAARVRDDDARARAGHPAREGGQQHLHQPGAARAGGVDLPRRDRARTGCATSRRIGAARAAELEAALAAAGAPRLHDGPVPQRVRRPGARTRAAVHARLLDRGVLAGHPDRRPAARRAVARRRAAGVRDGGHHGRRDRAVRDGAAPPSSPAPAVAGGAR